MAVDSSQRYQLARELQRSLSPETMPQLSGYDLAAYSQPAEQVGGDCYDVHLNGRLNLLVADATGHGLPAAVYMARTQAYLRAELGPDRSPAELLTAVNRRLTMGRSFRMYATAVCAQVEPSQRRLHYARAGHNPPLWVHGGQVHSLALGTSPLGVYADLALESGCVDLAAGDAVVLHTDGLIEAANPQGEMFTEERLIAELLEHREATAQEILDGLVDAVNAFIGSGPQEDDITVVVLKVGEAEEAERPESRRSLLGGEQRPVALGFVRLEEVAGAQAAGVKAEVEQRVGLRQGVWEWLAPEALLTVFGAPQVHEDDAAREVELVHQLRSWIADRPGMGLRAGLHVGQAILRPDGRMEYSLIGEALNRTLELERQAEAGQILLSEELRELAGAYLDLPERPVVVEGVGIAHVLPEGPLRRIEHWQRLEWTETTPYEGRERELARLEELWRECAQRPVGYPRLVGIRGEAGLGKSRLLREFARRMQQMDPPCPFLKGRAQPYGNPPYVLFGSLFLDYLHLVRSGEEGRAALEREVEDLAMGLPVSAGEALRNGRPLIGYLLGIRYEDPRLEHLEGQGFQQEMQRAVGEFARRIFQRAGCSPVIQLEDLHWADAGSLRLLGHLRANLELPTPPLVIVTYREQCEGLAVDEEIVLQPLDRPTCGALVRGIVGERSLPEAMQQLWVERSAGNPLFLEELAQVFLEEEKPGDAAFVPEREIPDTLMGLLLAQMDRLDGMARRVVQMAAVLGQEFEVAVLRQMAEKTELAPGSYQVSLEAITRSGLVFLQDATRGRFKHALTRDAAYETLLPGDRQLLHVLAAEAFEEIYAESTDLQVYALAHHYVQARQRDKGLHYILPALRQAYLTEDVDRGLSLAEQGLELVGPVTDRQQAWIRREILRQRRKIYTNVREEYEQAHTDNEAIIVLGERFDSEWIAEAYAFGSWIYSKSGDFQRSNQSALQALEFQDRIADPAILGTVFHYAGFMACNKGEFEQSVEYLERAIELRQQAGEEWDSGDSYLVCGSAHVRQYNLERAESSYRQALRIFQNVRDRMQIASLHDLLGNCRFLAGDLEGSIDYHLQALQGNIPFGKNWIYLIITVNLAQCYYEAGREEQAEHYYQECLQRARELEIRDMILVPLYSLSRLYAEQDRPAGWEQAVEMAEEVLAIAAEIGYPGGRILGLSGKAMALAHLGQIREACRASGEAVALLESQGRIGGNHEEGLLEERIFFEHYRVLSAADRGEEGRRYLARAHAGLMALVEAVGQTYREVVLRNLKFHRELVAAWEKEEPSAGSRRPSGKRSTTSSA